MVRREVSTRSPRGRLARLFLVLGFGLLIAAWVGSNAPGFGPDEPANFVKEVGAGTGQWSGTPGRLAHPAFGGGPGRAQRIAWINQNSRTFRLPAGLNPGVAGFPCNLFRNWLPVNCLDAPHPRVPATHALSYVGTYEPFVYAVPGAVMARAHTAVGALYTGRAVTGGLVLALLTIAVLAAWDERAGTLSLLGVLLATSPMVLFMGSVLGTNGVEIAGATALFALMLRFGRPGGASSRWYWPAVGVVGAALALCRASGPAWVMLAPVVALAFLDPPGLLRRLRPARAGRSGGPDPARRTTRSGDVDPNTRPDAGDPHTWPDHGDLGPRPAGPGPRAGSDDADLIPWDANPDLDPRGGADRGTRSGPRRRGPAAALRHRATPWVVLAAAGVVATALWERSVQPHPGFAPALVTQGLHRLPGDAQDWVRQWIGVFGWASLPMPGFAYRAWEAGVLVLAVTAAAVGTWRQRLQLGAVVLGGATVAVALDVLVFRQTWFPVFGRYLLPIAVLLPLAAGEVLTRRAARVPTAVRLVLAGTGPLLVATVHTVGLWADARRYAVGTAGPAWFFGRSQWVPPGGWVPWVALTAAGVACLLALAVTGLAAGRRHDSDDHQSQTTVGRYRRA